MNLSVNAWLQHKIDEYKFAVRDMTVDFYLAQAKLNRPDCSLNQLRNFNDTCLDMAELCQLNGDEQSYLHALGKLHHRLLQEVNNTQRERLFRMQACQLARHTLTKLCQQLTMSGDWEKATVLQSRFCQACWLDLVNFSLWLRQALLTW